MVSGPRSKKLILVFDQIMISIAVSPPRHWLLSDYLVFCMDFLLSCPHSGVQFSKGKPKQLLRWLQTLWSSNKWLLPGYSLCFNMMQNCQSVSVLDVNPLTVTDELWFRPSSLICKLLTFKDVKWLVQFWFCSVWTLFSLRMKYLPFLCFFLHCTWVPSCFCRLCPFHGQVSEKPILCYTQLPFESRPCISKIEGGFSQTCSHFWHRLLAWRHGVQFAMQKAGKQNGLALSLPTQPSLVIAWAESRSLAPTGIFGCACIHIGHN